MGIDPIDMLNDAILDGTPALKAFQAFVNPREASIEQAMTEALGPAARRTAHQISCLVRERRSQVATYLRNSDRSKSDRERVHPLTLVLDNIRSAFNTGSIFRTAETAAVGEIICCGLTPFPPHEKLRKTAFGAEEMVPARQFASTKAAVQSLKSDGFTIFAMETTSMSLKYTTIRYPKKTALIMGNEGTGVDISVLEMCDRCIEIPTYGLKNSLNVASAAPVVVFEIIRQWEEARAGT